MDLPSPYDAGAVNYWVTPHSSARGRYGNNGESCRVCWCFHKQPGAQTVRAIFAAKATTATLGWARARYFVDATNCERKMSLTVDRYVENLRLKISFRGWPLYEDRDARISILAAA
jgi:hypothetical protein